MLSENEIVERIKRLQEQLKLCEELYAMGNICDRNSILVVVLNRESQLDALHYVLGKKYVYKYK